MNLHVKDLEGRYVRLELIKPGQREELRPLVLDPRIWTHMPERITDDNFDRWFDEMLCLHEAVEMIIYMVRLKASGKLVGSSRYMSLALAHARLEIGYSWYHPSAWGTEVNPECKLLLFGQAFERLGARRVEQKTDALNERSRAAMLKSGAKFEGIFRKHMVRADGSARDSAFYALIDDDWPRVKKALEARCYG